MKGSNAARRQSSEYSAHSNDDIPKVVPLRKIISKEKKKAAKGKIYRLLYSDPMAWIGTVTSFILGISPIIVFLFFGNLINCFSHPDANTMDLVSEQVMYIIIVTIITAVLRFLDAFFWIRLGSKISIIIRRDLFSAMMKADVIFFDKTPIGAILTMLSEDSQLVQNVFGSTKGRQLQNLAQYLTGIVLSFLKNWRIGLINIAVTPVSLCYMFPWFNGIINDTATKFHYTAESMTIAEEVLSSIRTVRGFNKEKDEADRFLKATKESARYESYVGMRVTGMLMGLFFIMWIGVVSSLYVGGLIVDKKMKENDKSFGPGHLFSVFGYLWFSSVALMSLTDTLQGEQKAFAAGARIFDMAEYVPVVPYEGGRTIDNFKGHIKFVNVTFQYPTRPVNVLCNVSFEVKPGQVAALVGHSGSGKSTCVQLLERYYDVQEGVILLDDIDIKEIDPRWLHRQISLVAQEPLLFHASIRDNITYGLKDVTDDEVKAAAQAANALKFIEKLPEKFNEEVGERGSTLSGGQRQRIAIARAIVRKPTILITDEATSALDAGSEKKVQQALDNILKDLTGVVVAHRLSTIRNANIIYVFTEGGIVEQGTHDELVAKGGAYFNLVKRQLENEDNNNNQKEEKKTEVAPEKVEEEQPKKTEEKEEEKEEVSSSSSLSSVSSSSSSSTSSKSKSKSSNE